MYSLRRIRRLACFLLAGFALSLGVAWASPFVHPPVLELICTSAGEVQRTVLGDDGAPEPRSHTLDCPLCLLLGAPPPPVRALALAAPTSTPLLLPAPRAHIAARTAAPPPARGPPLF